MSTTSMVTSKTIGLKILLCSLILHTNNSMAQQKSTQKPLSTGVSSHVTVSNRGMSGITLTNITLTGFCQCKKCCGPKAKGICADGHRPVQGITIAASRSIPLGTKVLINGHTYTVQDRLARRFDKRIDIYFNSHKDALHFGKQTNNVTVLSPR